MGVVLPGELAWVLNLIGITWPNVDEDQVRQGANELRKISGDLENHTGDAKSEIQQMLGVNSGQAMKNFNALWSKVADGHLPQLGEGIGLLADGLDISAVVIEGLKLAAIVQLGILAAEIIADQAAAPFTLGGSEAAIPVETEATSQIVKQLLQQAIKSVEKSLLQVVEGPVFSALQSAAGNLAGQLLGDALGTHSGVDLGDVARSGESGFGKGLQTSEQQVATIAHNPAGSVEKMATGQGIPTGNNSGGAS